MLRSHGLSSALHVPFVSSGLPAAVRATAALRMGCGAVDCLLQLAAPASSSFHNRPAAAFSTTASTFANIVSAAAAGSSLPIYHPASSAPVVSAEELAKMKAAWPQGLSDKTLEALWEMKLGRPTRTQTDYIPSILRGESVLIAAATGTGKTLAYVAPILQLLKEAEASHAADVGANSTITRRRRPRALILAPTRELCVQILEVVKRLSHVLKLRSLLIVGGTKQGPQRQALDTPVDIVVGTPGRLAMLHQQGHLMLTDVRHVVVDEADTMIGRGAATTKGGGGDRRPRRDEGFGDDLAELLKRIKMREQSAQAAAKHGERKAKERLLNKNNNDNKAAGAAGAGIQVVDLSARGEQKEEGTADIDAPITSHSSPGSVLQYVLVGATIPQGMAKKLAAMLPSAKDAIMRAHGGAGAAGQLQRPASPSAVNVGGAASLHVIPPTIQQEFRRVGGGPNAKHAALAEVLSETLLMGNNNDSSADASTEDIAAAGADEDGTRGKGKRKSKSKSKSGAPAGSQVIVFCNSVAAARSTAYFVAEQGYSAACLHGDIPPDRRSQEFELFRSGQVPLLICTDAAARGLDFPSAGTVVLFDFPKSAVEYVHRAGRVGRAGSLSPKAGTGSGDDSGKPFSFRCISLCGPKDEYLSRGIEKAVAKGLPVDPNQSPVPPTALDFTSPPAGASRRTGTGTRGSGRPSVASGGLGGKPRLRRLNERAPSITNRTRDGPRSEGGPRSTSTGRRPPSSSGRARAQSAGGRRR